MRFRVLSDLHIDYNGRRMPKIPHSDLFTVFAGDVCGDPESGAKYIRKIADKGVVIAGNHIVYNDRRSTLDELKSSLCAEFPPLEDISFLDASTAIFAKEYEGVMFLGSTMYTDYALKTKYNKSGDIKKNIAAAEPRRESGMNDFRHGRICDEFGLPRKLTPYDYGKMNRKTVEMLDTALSQNEALMKKPVVMVTHHAPLKQCLPGVTETDDHADLLDASYASDMSDFIERHGSIRCWVYGHTHFRKTFHYTRKDGSKCLLVNNSFGYRNHFEDDLFPKMCVIDTDTWTITNSDLCPKHNFNIKNMSKEDLMMLGFGFAWN